MLRKRQKQHRINRPRRYRRNYFHLAGFEMNGSVNDVIHFLNCAMIAALGALNFEP